MSAFVSKPGEVLGYSVKGDVIYLCFSVPNEAFTGLYTSIVAFRFPKDDLKQVIKAIEKKDYSLSILFSGAIIKDIRFNYCPKNIVKEVTA